MAGGRSSDTLPHSVDEVNIRAGFLAAYDFSSAQTIGDIGGGRGHLLRAILQRTTSTV